MTLLEKTLHKDHTHYHTGNNVGDALVADNYIGIQTIVKSVKHMQNVYINLVFCGTDGSILLKSCVPCKGYCTYNTTSIPYITMYIAIKLSINIKSNWYAQCRRYNVYIVEYCIVIMIGISSLH